MDEERLEALLVRRGEIEAELRSRLGLPGWSNIRGDDVISLVEALDDSSRVRVNDLLVERQEIEDERNPS